MLSAPMRNAPKVKGMARPSPLIWLTSVLCVAV